MNKLCPACVYHDDCDGINKPKQCIKAKSSEQPVAITGETSDGYHTFNELYEHRHALFRLACLNYDGWKSKLHDDGTMFDGWFIAGVETPDGQVTYHLPIALWDSFAVKIYVRAPKWDGHTSSDVVNRLTKLATREREVSDDKLLWRLAKYLHDFEAEVDSHGVHLRPWEGQSFGVKGAYFEAAKDCWEMINQIEDHQPKEK